MGISLFITGFADSLDKDNIICQLNKAQNEVSNGAQDFAHRSSAKILNLEILNPGTQ